MWRALALVAFLAVSPVQAQDLELKNVRMTYGPLGQERKDDKFLPGDSVVFTFDIEGLKVQENGRIEYAMGMELTRKGKAKPEFKQDPQDTVADARLGGNALPAFAVASLGIDAEPGEYTMKVTIRDRLAKTEKELVKTFNVVKSQFSFVRVHLTNSAGEPNPPAGYPGQGIWLNYCLVGYEVGKDDNPDFDVEIIVLDDAGKPTLGKSLKSEIRKGLKNAPKFMPFQPSRIELNRAGKFTLMLKSTDKLSKKTTETKLDLNVLPLK